MNRTFLKVDRKCGRRQEKRRLGQERAKALIPRLGARIIVHFDARCACGGAIHLVTRHGFTCAKCQSGRILPADVRWIYHPLYTNQGAVPQPERRLAIAAPALYAEAE